MASEPIEQAISPTEAVVDMAVSDEALVRLDSPGEIPLVELTAPEAEQAELGMAGPWFSGGLPFADPWKLAIKRAIDIAGSLIALLLLTPVFLVIALAVRLTSPGPAFYVQDRVGQGGRIFKMLKFRSMYRDAHDTRLELIDLNECSGPVFKIRDDPRVTTVGRIMRRLSLDELPQLVNVLLGDMSLVGPRPALPEECEHYGRRERQRLLAKPGITCIWQVSGRSNIDFDTWIDLDLRYIRTWSLAQDLKLLAKTIPAVLFGRGAY